MGARECVHGSLLRSKLGNYLRLEIDPFETILMHPLFANYFKGWRKSFDFKGKISRIDFWYFVAVDALVAIAFFVLFALFEEYSNQLTKDVFGYVAFTWYFIGFIPRLSISSRRLNDMGKGGWWLLVIPLPPVNLFIPYWLLQPTFDSSKEETFIK